MDLIEELIALKQLRDGEKAQERQARHEQEIMLVTDKLKANARRNGEIEAFYTGCLPETVDHFRSIGFNIDATMPNECEVCHRFYLAKND